MQSSIRLTRQLLVGFVAGALALSMLQAAQAAKPPVPQVPGRIAVPEGNKPYLDGHATGVQIYSCSAATGTFAWGLLAPQASLYDDHGKLILTHFAGPTWQAKGGSSKVVGQRVDGVTVDATAIPWLLLSAVSTTPGRLGSTTFIQRIATTGGLPPAAADCNATTAGVQVSVPYTADYIFWKKQGKAA